MPVYADESSRMSRVIPTQIQMRNSTACVDLSSLLIFVFLCMNILESRVFSPDPTGPNRVGSNFLTNELGWAELRFAAKALFKMF